MAAVVSAPVGEAELNDLFTEGRRLAGHIAAAQYRLAEITTQIVELIDAHGVGWGFRSDKHRIGYELGLVPHEVTKLVDVARRLDELPATKAAFAAGQLNLATAATIASVATPATDESLVGLARDATPAQLQKICATYRTSASNPNREPARRRFDVTADEGGGHDVSGHLDADEGALLQDRLRAIRNDLHTRTGTRATNADALMALVRGDTGTAADRFCALITVDADRYLAGEPGAGRVLGGPVLDDATLARILEDVTAIVVVNRNGRPAWISDASRTPPPWMRRLLRTRHTTCAYPGCAATGYLEAHHLTPYTQQPDATVEELALVCGHHHRHLHTTGATLVANGDGTYTVHKPDGTTLGPPTPPPTPHDTVEDLNADTDIKGPTPGPHDPLTHWALDTIVGNLGNADNRTADHRHADHRQADHRHADHRTADHRHTSQHRGPPQNEDDDDGEPHPPDEPLDTG